MKICTLAVSFIFLFFTDFGKAENGDLPDFMPVTDVVFMGAHNAAMSTKEGWVYAQQNQDLEGLWKSGVRMVKVPMQWYKPSGPIETLKKGWNKFKQAFTKNETPDPVPFFALCHEYPGNKNCIITKVQRGGKDPQPIQQFFERLATLLRDNPKDIFILKIENYIKDRSKDNGTDQYSDQQAVNIFVAMFESSGLAQYAISLSARGDEPLTLGEMRSTNKRLIILDSSNMTQMPSYINNFTSYTRQTHWDTELMKDCVLAYDNPMSPLFFEINNGPEASIRSDTVAGKVITGGKKVIDALGGKKIEASDYKQVNSEKNIKDRFEQCYKKHKVRPNIITSDFSHEGDLKEYVKKLNQERVAEHQSKR